MRVNKFDLFCTGRSPASLEPAVESQLDLECRAVLVCPKQADQGEPVALPVGPSGADDSELRVLRT